ncbi:MAG: protein kinase [Planctomycetes bacterium]|nr:protein kinase [Planctomycetota bacterium]
MAENDPNRTAPRVPRGLEQTADHDTPAGAGNSSAVPDPTTPPLPDAASRGTVVRTPSDLARLERSAHARAETVAGYELLSELGRGGMGVVYKARHVKLNRVVALKMMLGDRVGGADLARFLAEAEAVAAVRHENVVQVYECGEADGRPYMALEFCPGGTLARLLPADHGSVSSSASARDAARLVAQVARGVAAAHAQGIVHRDLKPGNVLLDAAGAPKVADFGLVKYRDRSDVTRTGQVMGTPAYMSPEQAKGESKFVGPPADVWALGVILYQALTGARPFAADNPLEMMIRIGTDDPTPPRAVVAAVPRDLELICLKCLAKRPGERYPSAKELADDLDRYLRHEPISVRPAGPVERAYKWARRNKTLSAALVVCAAAAAALVGLAVSQARNADLSQRTQSVEKDLGKTNDQLNDTKAQLDDTKQKAERDKKKADDDLAKAERAKLQKAESAASIKHFAQIRMLDRCRGADPSLGLRLLANPDACPDRFRDFTWGVLKRLCRERLTLTKQPGTALSVSRDGKVVALGDTIAKAAVRLLDVETGRELRALAGHAGAITAVSFAARADALASVSADGTARVWDPATATARHVLKVGSALQSVALAPDAAWVAAGPGGNPFDATARPTAIKLWHLTGGNEPTTTDLAGHTGPVWALAVSPDGKTLASASADGTVRLWDVAKGTGLAVKRHGGWVTSVAFAPDGRTVASGGADGTLNEWAVDGTDEGKAKRSWSGEAAGVYGLAYSPDGKSLASAHEGGTATANQVRVWGADTGKLRYGLDMTKARILSVAFDPTGQALVAADQAGTVRFWYATPTEETLAVKAHLVGYTAAYSPAGDEIATGGLADSTDNAVRVAIARDPNELTGDVKLWDARTGQPRRLLGSHKGKVLAVAYSPDGGTLASGAVDGSVKLWDTKTGAQRGAFRGHTQEVRCIAIAHKARIAASAGRDRDVRVWDLDTGAERLRLVGHEDVVMGVAFSPDDTTLFTAGHDKTVRVWDLSTGKEKANWKTGPDGRVFSLALSEDGRTVYTGEALRARAWDAQTGAALPATAEHQNWVFGLAPGPGGRTLATGSADGTVKIWEQDGMREVMTLRVGPVQGKPESVQVKCLSVSPDGKALAGIATDGMLRIWR